VRFVVSFIDLRVFCGAVCISRLIVHAMLENRETALLSDIEKEYSDPHWH